MLITNHKYLIHPAKARYAKGIFMEQATNI